LLELDSTVLWDWSSPDSDHVAALAEGSPATGRRRLTELETVSLIEVVERPGRWLSVRVIVIQEEAAAVADRYACEGLRRAEPRQDPSSYRGTHP
jgi:hypothetical protein